jgi:hypothetical protein
MEGYKQHKWQTQHRIKLVQNKYRMYPFYFLLCGNVLLYIYIYTIYLYYIQAKFALHLGRPPHLPLATGSHSRARSSDPTRCCTHQSYPTRCGPHQSLWPDTITCPPLGSFSQRLDGLLRAPVHRSVEPADGAVCQEAWHLCAQAAQQLPNLIDLQVHRSEDSLDRSHSGRYNQMEFVNSQFEYFFC